MHATRKHPTLADLEALPPGIEGEIIEGVDLDARSVVAHRLRGDAYVETGVFSDETDPRIEPFEAVPLDVASWW